MLTLLGDQEHGSFCDGVSRRSFLKIGSLALGGLSMPQLLAAQGASGHKPAHKAIIMIFLPGGPPHQDMWDLKPNAPAEIRGEFSPIRTSVRGIHICELMPRTARMMDKFVLIRSLVGSLGDHSAYQCMTGRDRGSAPAGGWPCLGAVVSELKGTVDPAVPATVGLAPRMGERRWGYNGESGFLSPVHAPFTPLDDQVKQDMVLKGASLNRLDDRRSLLRSFDHFRRRIDRSGLMDRLDAAHQQAFGILTSHRLAEAFDLEREAPKLRDRYGRGSATRVRDGGPRLLDQFLLARRLVEAGARCVSLAFSRWDWHGGNFSRGRSDIPMLDQGVSALVQDLHDRGLDQDVSVVVWGEFGRTPKINKNAGRDHWPNVAGAMLAAGGMRTGQVIGATDAHAAEVADRPVHFQEVFATLYHNVGINVETATITDLTGRPHYLVDPEHKPMAEVI